MKKLVSGNLEKALAKFPPRAQHWLIHNPHNESSPIVVGGCGRSGTSLFRVMLDSHRNIICGPESWLLLPFMPQDNILICPDPNKLPKRIPKLAWLFGLDENLVVAIYIKSESQASFAESFFELVCESSGKPRWAEKTPMNVLGLEWSMKRWPNARFIHVIRDGRDVVCSLKEHPKWKWQDGKMARSGKSMPLEYGLDRWNHDVTQGRRWKTSPRYREVRYEDLVTKPKKIMKDVLAWLGEPWDPNVLQYHKTPRDLERDPQAVGTDQPLFNNSMGRWRSDLSDSDKRAFKNHKAGNLLIQLGYVSGSSWR